MVTTVTVTARSSAKDNKTKANEGHLRTRTENDMKECCTFAARKTR